MKIARLQALGLVLFALFCLTAKAEASPMTPALPEQIGTEVSRLEKALKRLGVTDDKRAVLETAEDALKKLAKGLDIYFHGRHQNTDSLRATALSTRKLIQTLQSDKRRILVLVHGVMHFHKRIHAALASAYRALNEKENELRHLIAILGTVPQDAETGARLKALTQVKPR